MDSPCVDKVAVAVENWSNGKDLRLQSGTTTARRLSRFALLSDNSFVEVYYSVPHSPGDLAEIFVGIVADTSDERERMMRRYGTPLQIAALMRVATCEPVQ